MARLGCYASWHIDRSSRSFPDLSKTTCLSTQHTANSGEWRRARWRRFSMFAPLCEIPCRIEKVRDNLGGGVFRQGSSGYYFGVRSNPGEVATVQAGSSPSRSRKPRGWPVHPKPDIHHRLPERRLCPQFSPSMQRRRRRYANMNKRPKLGRSEEPASVCLWVLSNCRVSYKRAGIVIRTATPD
jgi:hypothetical protein